jgi:hypothetical protein
MENSKIQHPKFRKISNFKLQQELCSYASGWDLDFGISLNFEFWSLGFSSRKCGHALQLTRRRQQT